MDSSVIMRRSNVISLLEEYKREDTSVLSEDTTLTSFKSEIMWNKRRDEFLRSLGTHLHIWMRALSLCDCDDPFLTAVFINLYNTCCVLDLRESPRYFRLKDEIANQLLLDRDLTDVREGVNYGLMNIGSVIKTEDWDFLKVLILYGIIKEKETLTRSVEAYHVYLLSDFLLDIAPMNQEFGQVICFHLNVSNILLKVDLKTFDFVDAYEKAKILRKYKVLKSLACKDYVSGTNPSTTVLKCLNYYFEVIPDPFVTVRELEDITEIPGTSQSMFDMNRHRNFMIEYSRLFPESGVLQPRSLKHLSRCAVREHICKYGLLPNVVSRLMIPKAIKDYLLVVNPES